MKNLQVAYLAVSLLLLSAACGPAEPVINDPTTASAPAASANPSSEVEARLPASRVLAETTFVHDGFRTEVSDILEGAEIGSQASSAAEGRQTLTVSLRNLSRSTGGFQKRATINFAPGLNNFVVLPTAEGPLTLYLHRSGRLGLAPDTGGFT